MRRFPWFTLVILLLGILFLREARWQKSEEVFLRWLLKNAEPRGPVASLTVVEIGADQSQDNAPSELAPLGTSQRNTVTLAPFEMALFLKAALDFQPGLIAFENVLKWRERDKDQEQMFIDQAMRVPKLLLAAELTATPDPDAPGPELPGFSQVSGRRADLAEYSGISRQPVEDMRLISSAGFVNLPDEIADDLHVPLLFQYRGEVIPSFALQAVLLWMRATPAEVKIELGSRIILPNGHTIPIRDDGTLLINPNAAKRARRITLNQLVFAADELDRGAKTTGQLENMRDQVVLARIPANPLSPPDVFAATIATIQNNAYLRRISWIFDCLMLVAVVAIANPVRRFSRIDLLLSAIAFSAAYCLIALGVLSHWLIWLPGVLPLGAVWVLVLFTLILPTPKNAARTVAVAASPPAP
jgi:hypothetical protein